MNKAQTLVLQAHEAAVAVDLNATEAEAQIKLPARFTAQGGNALDYPAWLSECNDFRNKLKLLTNETTASERAAAEKK